MKTAALVIVGLLIAGGVAWYAAEQHYDSCIAAAIAANPLGDRGLTAADREELPSGWDRYRDYVDPESPLNEVADRPRQRRADAIDGCSHWPW